MIPLDYLYISPIYLSLLILQVLSHICPSISHVHQLFLMFSLISLVSSHQLILSINCSHIVIVASTYDSTLSLRIFVPKISYNSLYRSPIFPISSSSSHSSILPPLISSSFSSLLILLFPFLFHLFQFLFNCPQYSLSNLLSFYPYNIFTVYLPSNSPLLSSFQFLLFLVLPISPYSSLNSLTKSSAFPKFSLGSQVSSSAV